MFILYAVVIGLLVAIVLGGRLERLGEVSFRWPQAALGGLMAQVLLFWHPVASRVGDWGTPLYLASSGLVLAAVLRNLAIPGLRLVAVGAILNLAAIVANGGSMPASPEALAAIGKAPSSDYTNSAVTVEPALPWLTDVFATPAWVPFSNVFSIGDLLMGIGVAWTIVAVSRGGARRHMGTTSASTGTGGSWPELAPARTIAARTTGVLRRRIRPGQTRREAGTQSQGSGLRHRSTDSPVAGPTTRQVQR
jgi:Family of unknown function (DUF5317)